MNKNTIQTSTHHSLLNSADTNSAIKNIIQETMCSLVKPSTCPMHWASGYKSQQVYYRK